MCLTLLHRYAFRSTEKVQLQEIGPRFTLKLRSLRKGLPAVKNLGEVSKDLEFDTFEDEEKPAQDSPVVHVDEPAQGEDADMTDLGDSPVVSANPSKPVVPPKEDEYVWMWKVCDCSRCASYLSLLTMTVSYQPELETTRRTFFL